jgi:hypothetical protein
MDSEKYLDVDDDDFVEFAEHATYRKLLKFINLNEVYRPVAVSFTRLFCCTVFFKCEELRLHVN